MKLNGRADARVGLWIVVVMAATAVFCSWPSGVGNPAYGQDDPAAADGSWTETKAALQEMVADLKSDLDEGEEKSLGKLLITSGMFGIIFYSVLAIFSLVALTMALDRLIRLTRRRVVPPTFVAGLQNLVRGKNDTMANFRTLCTASPSPAGRILAAGVARAGRPFPEVEKSMEDVAARELTKLRGRNKPLEVVGGVAPLVGLLGTVVGMIFAFRMASQQGLGRAEVFAKGIYLALLTTAAGLMIAIPCLLLYAWFNSRADKYMHEILETLTITTPSFERLERKGVVGGDVAVEKAVKAEAPEPEPATVGSGA